ncbi:MAG: penicillin-binding transpeptidase domain-containing protein, partial [Candidatus Roseilinea sp.]
MRRLGRAAAGLQPSWPAIEVMGKLNKAGFDKLSHQLHHPLRSDMLSLAVNPPMRYNETVSWVKPLRTNKHLNALWLVLFLLFTSCSELTDTPAPTSTSDSPVAKTPTALPSAVGVALAFVDALNNDDYETMYELLDEDSRFGLDAEALRQNFAVERATATALTVTYQLRGGMLTERDTAITSLVSVWQTILVDKFQAASVMRLKFSSNTWRVIWSRELILPGLSGGMLTMQRDVSQRGAIYAADGAELAVQQDRMTLGVRRGLIDSAAEAAMLDALSEVTGLDPAEIQARYAKAPADWFTPIATLDEDTLTQHSARLAPFVAVSAVPSFSRVYPNSQIAPHVVGYIGAMPPELVGAYRARGFAGDEQIGLSGVEGYMNAVLMGQPGGRLYLARDNGTIELVAERPFVRGMDVTLTISPVLQLAAQSILGNRTGAVIVLDARDSAVLAMASYPTFDNAIFTSTAPDKAEERARLLSDQGFPLLNRAIQGLYPPGSTFKIVTMAAGLSESLARADEIFADPGYWDGLGREYRKTCWLQRGHGRISLISGLSASCNVVFYEIGKRLDSHNQSLLAAYARRFGFGVPTGVELAGELGGVAPDPNWKRATRGDVWTSGDTVNMSIGQGFMLATPLQIAQMTAAIANGGEIRRPHVVARLSSLSSEIVVKPEVIGQLDLTPDVLQAIRAGMVGTINDRRLGTTTRQFEGFNYYLVSDEAGTTTVVPARRLTARQRSEA